VSTDLFPTMLAAAGEALDPEIPSDGEDLAPLLGGEGELTRDAIYFHCPSYSWHQRNRLGGAIRSGKYKLIERFDDQSLELYDLAEDPSESVNLAEKDPDRASELLDRLRAWQVDAGVKMPTPRER